MNYFLNYPFSTLKDVNTSNTGSHPPNTSLGVFAPCIQWFVSDQHTFSPLSLSVMQNGRSVSKRGVSCQFGPDVTERFLEENKLDFIVRSHEVKTEGYEVTHSGKCITVFSAPNYWYVLLPANFSVNSAVIKAAYLNCCFFCLPPVIRWETKEHTSTSGDQISSQNFTSSLLLSVSCTLNSCIYSNCL